MQTRVFLALLTLFALASLATAACGGGGESTDDKTVAADDGLSGSGADALRSLAKDLTDKSYQAVYDIETDEGDGKTDKGLLTIASKPPKSAFAVSTKDSAGVKTEFLSFKDDKVSYLCTKTGDEPGECLKGAVTEDGASAGLLDLKSLLSNLEEEAGTTVTEVKGRKIAGADSKCFKIKDARSEGTACFARSNGIMTLVDSVDNGIILKVQATKLSEKPDDKLFEVPDGYEVIDLGN